MTLTIRGTPDLFLDLEPEVTDQPPQVYPCGVLRWMLQCVVPTAQESVICS